MISNEITSYLDNKYLNKAEYHMGRLHLHSLPSYLTVVMGNGCNIDCRHCYQWKNRDNLFRDAQLGADLRRELTAFYPYLSTLRIQGGEVFALRGFEDLLDDIGALVQRPIVSISTNATLIDEKWARRIVAMPLQSMTVSLDAGTAATFERVRRGAKFDQVVANIERVQRLKQSHNSPYPVLDSFFVIMRSNFREIPQFLDLMIDLGIKRVSFQTMLVDARNQEREPDIVDEVLCDAGEVAELHAILRGVLEYQARYFHRIAWSGLNSLFSAHKLPADFLDEQGCTLTPDQDDSETDASGPGNRYAHLIPPEIHPELGPFPGLHHTGKTGHTGTETCRNPWSTMFITENGDVSLCFLSDPVGNLYQTPLMQIWNSPAAIVKRSHLLHGKYLEGGCSKLWCEWREGDSGFRPDAESWRRLLQLTSALVARTRPKDIKKPVSPAQAWIKNPDHKGLQAVRRLLDERDSRVKELEALIVELWDKNGLLHEAGQKHIDHLENRIKQLESQLRKPHDYPSPGKHAASDGP